ncbi:porin [Melaminivora jejuensis]|uniref:porin n=1 Tax=Melaminivora jejuensis TaxID=1267217 RepID=UPI001AE00AB9|nr:porin [Melaminivora jejuensis]UHJ64403.1 porin [Melaminivora jejuensis]
MKKSLIALAVLAASGTAMAQSSVTLFGIVDTNISHVNHANAAGDSLTGVGVNGNATSRIGFRGVEDLGGGLKAGFWLEAGHNPDAGDGKSGGASGTGLEFKRRSTVNLMGGFGEVRLGRDLVPSYTKVSSYDVFGQVGFGMFHGWNISTVDAYRQSNMLAYYTPNFGGFTGGLGYGFDEQVTGKNGRYMGAFAAFDNGPLSVTLAADRRDIAYPLLGGSADGRKEMWTLGGSYDLSVVKLNAIIQQARYKVTGLSGSDKLNSYALGLTAPVGAGQVRAQYAMYDQKAISSKAHQLSLGYVHNLSKRTALYGTVAHMRNKDASNLGLGAGGIGNGAPGMGENQTGLSLGVRHSF